MTTHHNDKTPHEPNPKTPTPAQAQKDAGITDGRNMTQDGVDASNRGYPVAGGHPRGPVTERNRHDQSNPTKVQREAQAAADARNNPPQAVKDAADAEHRLNLTQAQREAANEGNAGFATSDRYPGDGRDHAAYMSKRTPEDWSNSATDPSLTQAQRDAAAQYSKRQGNNPNETHPAQEAISRANDPNSPYFQNPQGFHETEPQAIARRMGAGEVNRSPHQGEPSTLEAPDAAAKARAKHK